jgi:hypothetical protein
MSATWKPADRVRHDHVVVDMKGLGHERDAIPVTFDGIEREVA